MRSDLKIELIELENDTAYEPGQVHIQRRSDWTMAASRRGAFQMTFLSGSIWKPNKRSTVYISKAVYPDSLIYMRSPARNIRQRCL